VYNMMNAKYMRSALPTFKVDQGGLLGAASSDESNPRLG